MTTLPPKTTHENLLGLTEQFTQISLDFFVKNLTNSAFLTKVIPGSKVEITNWEGNGCHLLWEEKLMHPALKAHDYLLHMESDLVFESQPEDSISPYVWDFYMPKNNLFFTLAGRIRAKMYGEKLKLGIYLTELQIRDASLQSIGVSFFLRWFRTNIREMFKKFRSEAINPTSLLQN